MRIKCSVPGRSRLRPARYAGKSDARGIEDAPDWPDAPVRFPLPKGQGEGERVVLQPRQPNDCRNCQTP